MEAFFSIPSQVDGGPLFYSFYKTDGGIPVDSFWASWTDFVPFSENEWRDPYLFSMKWMVGFSSILHKIDGGIPMHSASNKKRRDSIPMK